MARIELPPYIAAISGRIGKCIYRSRKQPDGTYKTFVHEYRPQAKAKRKTSQYILPSSRQSRANIEPTSYDNPKKTK